MVRPYDSSTNRFVDKFIAWTSVHRSRGYWAVGIRCSKPEWAASRRRTWRAVSRAGGLGMLSGTIGCAALGVQLNSVPVDTPVGVNFLVSVVAG